MLRRLLAIIKKEFLQLKKNKFILRLVFIAPIMQLTIFGYAAVLEVSNITIALLDRDNSAQSRQLRSVFKNSEYFIIEKDLDTEADINYCFDRDKINAAVIIPVDFSKKIKANKNVKIQIIIDGTNSTVAQALQGYIQGCVLSFNSIGKRDVLSVEYRFLYNPSLNNQYFFIPGVFAMIIFVIGMPITAMAIVREKEEGTYEQLSVTPIKPIEIIFGKIIPYILLIFIASTILTVIALFWFKLPLRGSLWLLVLNILLFVTNVLGLGILVSTVSNNQQQAMLTSFFIIMPAVMFSGFMFPIENMPPFSRVIAYINPMTHFVFIARDVFLKGGEFTSTLFHLSILALTGIIIFVSAISLVKKRIS